MIECVYSNYDVHAVIIKIPVSSFPLKSKMSRRWRDLLFFQNGRYLGLSRHGVGLEYDHYVLTQEEIASFDHPEIKKGFLGSSMPNITIYSFTNEPWSDKYTWRASGSLDTGNGTFRYDCGVTIELNRIEPGFIEGLEEFRHGKLKEFHGLSKEWGVKNLREFTVMLRFDDLGAFFSDVLSHSLPKAMPALGRACKGKEFFLDIPHHLGHHSSIGAATHYDQYDEAKSGTYGIAFDPALCKSVCEEICKAAKDYLASIGIDGELSICNYEKGATRDIPAIQVVEGEDIPSKAKENNAFAMR